MSQPTATAYPAQRVEVAQATPVVHGEASNAPVYGEPVQGQPPAYQQPVPAYTAPGMNQGPAQPTQAVVWVEEQGLTATEQYLISLLQYARTVKILSIIDIVFTVLNAIRNPLSLFLVAGPLCGLYGAIKFNPCLATCYLIYSALKTVFNILQLALYDQLFAVRSTWVIVVLAFSTVVQVWITWIAYKYRQLVADLTPEKLDSLARAEGNPNSRRLVFA
mmetsp:Transcript_27462/g.73910  ORF Transcript_27462/g.73910 Transcript_27462/m.73910 type:complete len:219 (+) Transcript_27462:106-762(+)